MAPVDVALRFVAAINAHDIADITALMTDGHCFVDSLGAAVCGKANMREGWQAYLTMVPDYQIDIRQMCHNGEVVVFLGAARGTYSPDGRLREEYGWETPAAWRVVVKGERVAEWQVYADNEPIRRKIAAHSAQHADAPDRPPAGR